MGERVGKILPFLAETACVHVEEREMAAWCEVYALMFPNDKEFIDWLRKVAKPAIIKLGQGKWYRDTVTDLALGLSRGKTAKKTESTEDILLDEMTPNFAEATP